MADRKLTIKVDADTAGLSRGMKAASAQVNTFGSSIQRGITKHAAGIRRTGMALAGLGAAMTGMAVVSIKAAADFERELAMVSTMLDKTAMKIMPKYEAELREMSKEFGEATKTLSKGLYDILSASIPPAKALDVLAVAATAARAGITDTGVAADAITTILNSYGMAAEEAGSVSDWLFAVVKRGKTTFAELAPAIGKVAATASIAGVNLEELGAMISTLTRAGIKSDQAMTAVLGVIRAFLKASKDGAKTAEVFGVALDTNTLKTEGLRGVMLKLIDANAEQLASIFPNIRGLKGFAAALGDAEGFASDYNLMLERAGMTQEAFEKQTNTLAFTFDQIKQEFADVFRVLGKELLPIIKTELVPLIREVIEHMKVWIERFKGLSPGVKKFLLLLGPLLIALGGLLMILPGLATAIGLLMGPIGWVVLAIAGLTAAFVYLYKTNKHFRKNINAIVEDLKMVGKALYTLGVNVKNWAVWFGKNFVAIFKTAWSAITTIVKNGVENLKRLHTWLGDFIMGWGLWLAKNYLNFWKNLFNGIRTGLTNFGKNIVAQVGWIWEKIKHPFTEVPRPDWTPLFEDFKAEWAELPKYTELKMKAMADGIQVYWEPMPGWVTPTFGAIVKGAGEANKALKKLEPTVVNIRKWQWFISPEQAALAAVYIQDHEEMLRRQAINQQKRREARKNANKTLMEVMLSDHQEMLEREDEAREKQRKEREKSDTAFIDVMLSDHQEMLEREDEARRKQRKEREKSNKVLMEVMLSDHEERLEREDEARRKQRKEREKSDKALIDVMISDNQEMLEREDEARRKQRKAREKSNKALMDVMISDNEEMLEREDEARRKQRKEREKSNEALVDVIISDHQEMLEREDEARREQKKAREKSNKALIDVMISDNEEMLEREDEARRKQRKAREKSNKALMDVIISDHQELLEREDEARRRQRREREKSNKALMDVMLSDHQELLEREDEARRKQRKEREKSDKAMVDVMISDNKEMLEREDEARREQRKRRETANKALIEVMLSDHQEMLEREDEARRQQRAKREVSNKALIEVMISDHQEVLDRQDEISRARRRQREGDESESIDALIEIHGRLTDAQEAESLKQLDNWRRFFSEVYGLQDLSNQQITQLLESLSTEQKAILKGLYDDWEQKTNEAARAMEAIWDSFTGSVKRSMSDLFVDLMSGTSNFKDAWQSFCDSIKQSFIRSLADMIVEKLGMDQLFSGNILEWGNAFAGLGGLITNVFKGVGSAVWGVMTSVGSAVWGVVKGVGSAVVGVAGKIVAALGPVGAIIAGIGVGLVALGVRIRGTTTHFETAWGTMGRKFYFTNIEVGELAKHLEETGQLMYPLVGTTIEMADAAKYLESQFKEVGLAISTTLGDAQSKLEGLRKVQYEGSEEDQAMTQRKIALTEIEIKLLEIKKEREANRHSERAKQLEAELALMLEAYHAGSEEYEAAEQKKQEATQQTTEAVKRSNEEIVQSSASTSQQVSSNMGLMASNVIQSINTIPKDMLIDIRAELSGMGRVQGALGAIPRDITTLVRTVYEGGGGGRSFQHGGTLEEGELVLSRPITDWIRGALSKSGPMGSTPSTRNRASSPGGSVTVNVPRGAVVVYGDIRTKMDEEEFQEKVNRELAEDVARRLIEP